MRGMSQTAAVIPQRCSNFSRRRIGVGLLRLLPVGWRLLRTIGRDEAVLAVFGRVALHRTSCEVIACTMVKGPPEAALRTGLQRLAEYAGGHNLAGLPVGTARPVVRRAASSGRWLVETGLSDVTDPLDAPVPRNRKIRVRFGQAETLAIIRMQGHPSARRIARAEDEIHATMAEHGWTTAGPTLLRLHTPLALLPLLGSFEIAVPVTAA